MAKKEYIERDAAINEQKRFCGYLDNDMLYRLEIATKRIHAADVRPVVKATWKRIDFKPYGHDYECSSCGWKNDMATKYCPNCGADMREES